MSGILDIINNNYTVVRLREEYSRAQTLKSQRLNILNRL